MDTSAVARVGERTGTAYVFVEPDGENRIALVEGANDEAEPLNAFDRVRDADCLLLQNEIPLGANRRLLSRLDGIADPPAVVLDLAPAAGDTFAGYLAAELARGEPLRGAVETAAAASARATEGEGEGAQAAIPEREEI